MYGVTWKFFPILYCQFMFMFSFCILRRIVIPASSFDGKVKFLEKTRKSFGGGTFNISEGALLESYYSFLKEEYYEGRPRQYYAAECIGLQPHMSDYWCLSKEVCYVQ